MKNPKPRKQSKEAPPSGGCAHEWVKPLSKKRPPYCTKCLIAANEHETMGGWCCACDYDVACFKEALARSKEEGRREEAKKSLEIAYRRQHAGDIMAELEDRLASLSPKNQS